MDDSGNPIGFVGCAVYTTGLVETLDAFSTDASNGMSYCMVGAADGKYIFTEDEQKVGTVSEEEYIQKLCSEVANSPEDMGGYIEYERDGEKYIAAYHYLSDYNAVFLIENKTATILEETNRLKVLLIVIVIMALIVLTVISLFIISKMTKPLGVIEGSIQDLQNFDITQKQNIKKITKRKDELGSITKATEYSEKVDSIKNQLDSAEKAVQQLYQFALQIADNMENVKCITNENQIAVNTIVEKNEDTSMIAGTIQKQSEENKELSMKLEEIIKQFKR